MGQAIIDVARIGVGVVLTLAGLAKVEGGPRRVLTAVLGYRMIRGRTAGALATALPYVEIGVGVALTAGALSPFTPLAGAVLRLIFALAIAVALVRGLRNTCGCGAADRSVAWPLVGRNLVFAAVLLLAAASTDGTFGAIAVIQIGALAILAVAAVGTLGRVRKPNRMELSHG
jgi:hypothetical protein